jgi:ectoine hydroxylase-related dioxygenase (phytanoyl-CoA dioxygenase family)
MAYTALPFAEAGTTNTLESIQFWVPLDDVDAENGTMQFVAGHHDGALLEHYVASGDPDDEGRLLALVDPESQLDLSTAVVAEIPAGGATMHFYGTPHYTGPNRSAERHRRAYIFNVATP